MHNLSQGNDVEHATITTKLCVSINNFSIILMHKSIKSTIMINIQADALIYMYESLPEKLHAVDTCLVNSQRYMLIVAIEFCYLTDLSHGSVINFSARHLYCMCF